MSDERYVLHIPFGFYGMYAKISGLTKKQVIDMTLARMKNGVFPDEELWDFITENSEFTTKDESK